jgi:hypothetical protein
MNPMQLDRNGRVLTPYLNAVADSLPDPREGLAEVLAQVAVTPQADGRDTQPRPGPSTAGRSISMSSPIQYIAAGVALAVIGAFGLMLPLAPSPTERIVVPASTSVEPSGSPSTDPTVRDPGVDRPFSLLPQELPEDADTEVVETTYGPARWARIQREAASIPEVDVLLPGPSGVLGLDMRCLDRVTRCPRLWAADDVLSEWDEIELPEEVYYSPRDATDFHPVLLRLVDETYWLLSLGVDGGGSLDGGMWSSTDTTDWQRLEIDGLEPPHVGPFKVVSRLGGPAFHDGRVLIPVIHQLDRGSAMASLGIADAFEGGVALMATQTPGTYAVVDWGEHQLGKVRVVATPTGIRVMRAGNGTVLTNVDNVTIDDLAWLGLEYTQTQLAIATGGGSAEALGEPWCEGDCADLRFYAAADGFHAFDWGRNDGAVRHWRSSDGRDWVELEAIDLVAERDGFPGVGPRATCGVQDVWMANDAWSSEAPYGALVQCSGGNQSHEVWLMSEDGRDWSLRPSRPPRAEGIFDRIGSRWIAGTEPEDRWWLREGDGWVRDKAIERVMGPPKGCEDPADQRNTTLIYGDSLVNLRYSPHRCARIVRVLEFDELD